MFKVTRLDVNPLQKHLMGTQYTLRWAIVLIVIALPIVLTAGGALYVDTSLQDSMSAPSAS